MNKNSFYILLYVLLVGFGIPWYWPEDSKILLLGAPIWVVIAILCSLLASILTAFILIKSMNDDEE
tara:strand:- start:1001 stop:1198 length:198 start_codon:yes stop_codon:yes gene_type:complete